MNQRHLQHSALLCRCRTDPSPVPLCRGRWREPPVPGTEQKGAVLGRGARHVSLKSKISKRRPSTRHCGTRHHQTLPALCLPAPSLLRRGSSQPPRPRQRPLSAPASPSPAGRADPAPRFSSEYYTHVPRKGKARRTDMELACSQ